ncbi:MAG TPA: hypothetical protein PKO09_06970 [Anaerolineae bacterium]|nr:hypothetical protein [Anaerolineae bacterium]
MSILVQKYGGTSLSSPERRAQVIGHIRRAREAGYQVAIVVSAMGRRGEPYATDTLLDLLRSDRGPVHPRDYDMVFGCGELISSAMMAHLLKREGIAAIGLSGAQAGIYTTARHGEAEIVEIDTARLHAHLSRGEVPVIAGCQGVDPATGDMTTLGRGGSDTSGVALGVALHAERVEIFTDVEGVARANPRAVPVARFLRQISHAKMLELARFGAGVVHPRAVRAGLDGHVPVVVRSTFSTGPGTLIGDVADEYPVLGIASLGPFRTVALDGARVGPNLRLEWEQARLVMSLVDAAGAALILGAATGREEELRTLQAQVGVRSDEVEGEQTWVSMVGDSDAIGAALGPALRLLQDKGIGVLYHELAPLRVTFVVAAHDERHAVQALYQEFMGG